jgi:hypothetical protein
MTRNCRILSILLATTAPIPAFAQEVPAGENADHVQTTTDESAVPVEDEYADEADGEDIVVVGQKPRGSVVGDIPPENTLTSRDIRATGATSISELLEAVESQVGSARGRSGGRPVLLLNGQRISGFRELRDLPPEAIERMEILPDEVALKYGYAADQRVVNIVLRRRFNSTTAELRGKSATDGGYVSGQADGTRLVIRDGQRTSINLHVESNSPLYESERDIVLQPAAPDTDAVDPRPYRTLTGARQDIRLSGTLNRTVMGDISATVNGEVQRETGKSRFGVPTGKLYDNGAEIVRAFAGDPLTRDTATEAIRLGSALNGQRGKWRLSSTANAEYSRSTTRTDRGFDLSTAQTRLDAGDPTFDPYGDLGPLSELDRNRSRSNRTTLSWDATANGPLFALPAGDANATFKVGLGRIDQNSEALRDDERFESDLGRTSGDASASLDLPITKRTASIGRLSANLNAGLTQLSDFGTLTSMGAGVNWSPAPRLNLLASWTREEGAPSLQQLGDPLLESPGVAYFDYTRGETVLLTTITGGNPALDADRRNVFKLSGNWQPFEKTNLRLRAEYVRQTIDRPQGSFPAATEALEAAFPDRFERDADGNLVRVDLRPVNFEKSQRETLRWGFSFSKPLASKPPSQAAIAQFRERFAAQRAARGGTVPSGDAPPPGTTPSAGDPRQPSGQAGSPAGAGPGGRFGGRGGGRFGGGRQGGRLTFSLTHQVNLVDEVTIADDLPKLDYLNGEAIGPTGGRSRHEIQAESGYYNNGLGARLQGNWRSGTTIDSPGGDLRFSPYADVDLRLFANLSENFELVAKHPFFRGTSVRLDIENILNNRPKVRRSDGTTPLSYQPDLLQPVGRTIGITFRKLFIPQRFFQRGGMRGGRTGG